jgi:hypothetical protein
MIARFLERGLKRGDLGITGIALPGTLKKKFLTR